MRIDKDDNIWAIDKGSDMVIKFNQAGRVQMGVRPPARNRPTRRPKRGSTSIRRCRRVDGLFRQPTDVAWDSNGNIYITDGYVNSRVANYDRNGDWVKSVGHEGQRAGAVPSAAHASASIATTTSTSAIAVEPPHAGLRHRRKVPAACSRIDVPPVLRDASR